MSAQSVANGPANELPRICFGTSRLKGQQYKGVLASAIRTGFRFFDTARSYGNEEMLGQALSESGLPRDCFHICTKLHLNALRREEAHAAISCSLQELNTEYIDLLLIHWPNPEIPLEETLQAMCQAKAAGDVRAIGVSNFPLAYLDYAVRICPEIRVVQMERHPMLKEEKIVEYAAEQGIAVMAYRPTGRGVALDHPLIGSLAEKYGRSRYQTVLCWHLSRSGVIPVCGTTQIRHIEENYAALSFQMDEADCRRIDDIGGNTRTMASRFAPDWSSIELPAVWLSRDPR